MDAYEIINKIASSKKTTPCKVVLSSEKKLEFKDCKTFECGKTYIVYGDYENIKPTIEDNKQYITEMVIENDARNSAIPLLNKLDVPARIEPGAIIRENVEIGKNAVIMMGAIINIGAVIGESTMIDMGAILGGRATVGKRCHIGAGAVLAGVIEPPSATPVIVEDDVLIGANAVVIEGVRIGKGSVVAAGAIVISDVPEGVVVAGVPARIIKTKDGKTAAKSELIDALRQI